MFFRLLLLLTLPLLAEEPWGTDAALTQTSSSNPLATNFITFFQEVISPINGMRSSYRPSSSEYAKQAISRYGFLRGIALGCDRLLRENGDAWYYRSVPWGPFCMKYDPVD